MELTKSKIGLTSLAKKTAPTTPPGVVQAIVRQLYDEIRRCRLKGHSWKRIAETIQQDENIPRFSPFGLNAAFRKVDLEYERKTGVPALSKGANRSGGRPRKGTERTA